MIVLAGCAGLLTGFREKAATRIDGGKAGAVAAFVATPSSQTAQKPV